MSKPKGRLLLTWNEKKHPEIVQFFDSIEQGLYSHHVREAIKFYMKYKDQVDQLKSAEGLSKGLQLSVSERDNSEIPINNIEYNENNRVEDDYEEFNPDMLEY